jgi:hypothetical protein
MALNRKITICICIIFIILFLLFAWGLSKWKAEDLRESMYNDFINAYHELFLRSGMDHDFSERTETYLSEFSATLARRGIYAAAIMLDAQGNIMEKTDVSNIYFNGRLANAVDLDRLESCIRDAQDGMKDESFPKDGSASIGASGPAGYTQGWTLHDDEGSLRYLFINTKFFEYGRAVQQLIPRYILTLVIMAIACFVLRAMIIGIIRKEVLPE